MSKTEQRRVNRAAWQIHTQAAQALGTKGDVVASVLQNVLAFAVVVYLLSLVYQS